MRVAKHWCLLVLLCGGVLTIGCDRVTALKDQLLGSSTSGNDVNPELEAIRSLYESGQHDSALQKAVALTQSDPNMAEAFYYKGLCHLALAGEPNPDEPLSPEEELALDAFRRALTLNPRHAPSSIGIGDLYARRVPARKPRSTEDPEDPYVLARSAYEKAVTIDPKMPEAQYHYARFLERTGDLETADSAYQAAAEAAATVPEAAPDYYIAYGKFLAGPADRLDEALDQFELAQMFRQDDAAIQQEMAIIHSRVGLRHFEKQEYMLAESALTTADSMFPDKSIPEAEKNSETLAELRTIRRR